MKRSPRERRVVFPWERRTPVLRWVSRRHARAAMLGTVVALGAYGLVGVEDGHRRLHVTRAAIRSITLATEAFRADHGRCPAGIEELARPPETPGGTARYLDEVRLDGWGQPFHLICPGWKHPASADVVSGGATGTFLDTEQVE